MERERMTPPDARILALLQAGDVEGAARLASEAIAAGGSHPLLFDARGAWRLLNGEHAAALDDFTQALALAPRNPGLHLSIARALIGLGRFAEAIASCDAALALDPRIAAAHFEKGCAAEMMGDLHLARRSFQQAASLAPNIADVPAKLASLSARRGDWAEARTLSRKALSLDPGNSTAILADVTAALGEGATEGQISRLDTVLAADGHSPETRAQALNLKANLLDRQDRIAEAFAGYTAANDTLLAAYAPRFAGLTPGAERVAALGREFAAIPPECWRGAAPGRSPAAGHVFVLGFYRTGTTLLGQILASHPAVTTLEEKPLLIDAATDFLDSPGGLERLATLSDVDADAYRARYWQRALENEPGLGLGLGGRVVVDKLPLNTIALPVIARLFPQAKVVFAVRDPRDVVFSCFRRLLNVNRDTIEMLSLPRGAAFYAAVMTLAETYRTALPTPVLDIRNEDLAADFETSVRGVCAFLGLTWKDSMTRFAEQSRTRSIATPSAAQVARGINSDGVGQWRRYRDQLVPILPVLEHWTARFGYSSD
jgi:tetratricopeptide (TPR) repeat protein